MVEQTAITEEMDVHKEWCVQAKQQTVETLPEFIRHLTEDYGHDYGTICHACAAAAVAAARAVNDSPQGGITGFQASVVMWEFLRGWGTLEDGPARITQYRNLLFPQYEDQFTKISADTWAWVQEEAKKELAKAPQDHISINVLDHWAKIIAGEVPFGLTVEPPEEEPEKKED